MRMKASAQPAQNRLQKPAYTFCPFSRIGKNVIIYLLAERSHSRLGGHVDSVRRLVLQFLVLFGLLLRGLKKRF